GQRRGVVFGFPDIETNEQCVLVQVECRHGRPFLVVGFHGFNRMVQAATGQPKYVSVGGSCSASTLENWPSTIPLCGSLGRRASISDPRSAATNSWVKTPPVRLEVACL